MEVHPKVASFKILLITVSLLFWASCVADTAFLKTPEERPLCSTIVSEDRPPQILNEERTASLNGVEQERPLLSSDDPHRATQHPAWPETKEKKQVAHFDSIENIRNIAASSKAESRKDASPSLTGKPEKLAADNAEPEGSSSAPPALPAVDKKGQITPPSHIDKEKILPYPRQLEEEEELPIFLRLEPDTVVPAPTDVEEELTILSSPPIERREGVLAISRLEKKPADRRSSVGGQARAVTAPVTMEQMGSIFGTDREERECSIPPEIEEPYEFVTLSQGDSGHQVRIPIWLAKGKPLPTTAPIGEAQRSASMQDGETARTPPSPKGGEEEERTPVEIEDPVPLSKETQKQLDQGMLDSALEFCQASNDFWEQGDLYNAIDALDQAYSLILKVRPEDDSGLLQQKEDLRFTISKRIIEVYSSRFTVANGRNSVIPLVMNRHVQSALNLFKGRERKFFLDSYRRSGKYRPAILLALREAGLPEELSWLPLIESGFKIRALSRSRALGLWQFVASTGYKFGLKRDRWVDERMDPDKSTHAAIAYLKELHQIFGDWTTALAAYNCGEGRVLKCIRTQRINYLDNFWDLYERLPLETAFYVPKFLAVLHILNDPEAHDFTLPPVDEEVKTDAILIDKQVHLKTISRYTGVPYTLLKEINSSLRYSFTPDRPFSFKMPKGKGQVLLSKLDEIPVWHPPTPAYVVHKVRRGESLSVIARKYGTSVRSIMRLNGLKSSHFIRTGWRLKIPTKRRYPVHGRVTSEVSGLAGSAESVQYVVQKGDSLWRIAERFGTTTKAIQSVNRLTDTHLSIGQVLMIPQELSTGDEIETKTYIVSKGDSPYLIATRHRMKLSQFLRINNLSPRSTIFPGQVLLVKAE